jgi:type II secretion system protein H
MFKRRKKPNSGFTLIEIMIVVFIGLTVTMMITLNTDMSYTDKKRIQVLAENMLVQLKLAKQSAIYEHAAIRFVIEGKTYGFQRFQRIDKELGWAWIANDPLLKQTPLNNNIAMQLKGSLVLYPSGRFEPFTLIISNKKNNVHFEIKGNSMGQMELAS